MNQSNFPIYPLLYAAPISFYANWFQYNGCMDGFENFQKQTHRNRCKIYGANGVITLSIPVQTNSKKVAMQQVHISNIEAWQRIHWRSIESAYKSSPFFEFYSHLWAPIYEKKYSSLWEFNLDIHHVILACLQSNSETCFTTEFIPLTNGDYRKVYSSKKVHPHSDEFPTYQQVFSYDKNFEPDLSIMDLIFNLGPEATDYLCHLKV
tara:strand:+ start:53729 stop:54349 length:621 start_codon:yes stop_codon:yes gene_type:complete